MKSAALLGGLLATVPFAWTIALPLVQDDWSFLARETPWWSARLSFWRPLSVGLYWRLAALVPSGHPVFLHATGLLVHLLAAAAVGLLGAEVLAAAQRRRPRPREAMVAALLWGTRGAHFLPVAWASAVQESFACLFGALALRQWLRACTGQGGRGAPVFLGLALLSKEGTLALVPMAALLALVVPRVANPARASIARASLAVSLVYFAIHLAVAERPAADSPYALHVGLNVVRNASALAAFLADVPREALRQVVERGSPAAATACLVLSGLSIAGWSILLWFQRQSWSPAQALALGTMAAVALLPYLPLAWNCYPYYTLLALVALSPVLAAGASRPVALALLLAAGLGSTAFEVWAPYPSFVARGRLADSVYRTLATSPGERRFAVRCRDEALWSALGWGAAISRFYEVPRDAVRQLGPDEVPRPDEMIIDLDRR